jgi:hypothetical protein
MVAMTTTTTRTAAIAQVVLALVIAFSVGTLLVPSGEAAKVASVKNRVQGQRDMCEIVGGGTLTVVKVGKATVTDCNGGQSDGYRCVFTKGTPSACHQSYTPPPPPPDDDVAPPPIDVAPPPGGGVDAPSDGSGSHDGGGVGGSDSGGTVEPPSDPGSSDGGEVILTSYHGGKQHHDRHHRQGHGKGRKT